MNDNLYLEDLSVGDRFETGTVTVTEEALLKFAREFDPQPMHIDAAAAAKGAFGGLIASGWHTAALTIQLIAESKMWGDTPALGMGVEKLEWPQPVRPGDTLHAAVEVAAVRPSKSNPGFGVATLDVTVTNQRGEVCYRMRPSCWVPRRPAKQ